MCVIFFRIPQYFDINSRTGAISSSRTLNRERIPLFEFLVTCRDLGNPPRSSVTKVKVTVLDVNDESPIFEQDTYEITLAENAPPTFLFQIKVGTNKPNYIRGIDQKRFSYSQVFSTFTIVWVQPSKVPPSSCWLYDVQRCWLQFYFACHIEKGALFQDNMIKTHHAILRNDFMFY